jgi:hypothetical protein
MLATQSEYFIDIQSETFLFNTNLTLKQQNADITKMQELIETDKSIVTLRESVKNTNTKPTYLWYGNYKRLSHCCKCGRPGKAKSDFTRNTAFDDRVQHPNNSRKLVTLKK